MFVFVFGFGFGTQLFMVEQTPIVYQAQTQTLGYETGFEHKNLCLCRSTQTVFVFSERTQSRIIYILSIRAIGPMFKRSPQFCRRTIVIPPI